MLRAFVRGSDVYILCLDLVFDTFFGRVDPGVKTLAAYDFLKCSVAHIHLLHVSLCLRFCLLLLLAFPSMRCQARFSGARSFGHIASISLIHGFFQVDL